MQAGVCVVTTQFATKIENEKMSEQTSVRTEEDANESISDANMKYY